MLRIYTTAFRGLSVAVCSLSIMLFSMPLLADHQTQILLTDETFIPSDPTERGKLFNNAISITDRDARQRYYEANMCIDGFNVDMAYERYVENRPDGNEANKNAFVKRFPEILKRHFESTLARYEHQISVEGNIQTITIKKGIEFWAELVNSSNPENKAAGMALLSTRGRGDFVGFSGKFVDSITCEFKAITRIMKVNTFTEAEWKAISQLGKDHDFSIARHGDYIILGKGQSFNLTNDVFLQSEKVSSPIQKRKFLRVVEFLAAQGIKVELAEAQGAAAYYDPLGNKIAYVMPSRGNLDTFTHEGTHARFQKLLGSLKKWSAKKNMAIPYEIDGPAIGLFGTFGGYMNLLNELNSWRIGTSFDKPMTDREILKLLKEAYVRQAGKDSVATFGKLWHVADVKGHSVAELIFSTIRAFNRMSNDDLLRLGMDGLVSGNHVDQMNYLRLVYTRFVANKKTVPPKFFMLATQLRSAGANDSVKDIANMTVQSITEVNNIDVGTTTEQREAKKVYSEQAKEWFTTLQNDQIKVIPLNYGYSYEIILYYAAQNNMLDYDAVIAALQVQFGGVPDSKEARETFTAILDRPGRLFLDKLQNQLRAINSQGFEFLWSEFMKKPDYDTVDLLIEHYASNFKTRHILELFRMALNKNLDQYAQGKTIRLLEGIFNRLGFQSIYDPNEYPHMIESQRAFNKKNGVSANSYIPVLRKPKPDHWLFSKEIDSFLAKAMFDKNPGVYRLDFINFLTEYTYPEELPQLRGRISQLITADKLQISKNDYWVARIFLIPKKSFYNLHLDWGRTVATAVLTDPTPSIDALEFVAEYYRLSVAKVLPYVKSEGFFDRGIRDKAREEMYRASQSVRDLTREAGVNLWYLLGNQDVTVRRAARYALATHPAFMLEVEAFIENALKGTNEIYRIEAIQLLSLCKPGFLPYADGILKSRAFTPTSEERELLELRLPINDRQLWQEKRPLCRTLF